MKIAATVILYHPDENVFRNILSYAGSVAKLFIVDNTESSGSLVAEHLERIHNAVYIHDGENRGIAARLNQVGILAGSDGFPWLLTMDQDSSFEEESFNDYLACFHLFENKQSVSMFGINHVQPAKRSQNCDAHDVRHLITSGSLLNLAWMQQIGGFDEKLFIDEVDFEYCLRSVEKGLRIIEFSNIFLTHNLGHTSRHRSAKTGRLTPRALHSPARMYYMTRNFLYVKSRYHKKFPEEMIFRRNVLLNRFKNNILYNKERIEVVKNIFKGFWDYKKYRMGKLK